LIDLHSHILPGIDDGSPDIATSLEMARMAVADGITVMACTPHIFPGVYENTGRGIAVARDDLAAALEAEGIPLQLVVGADAHIAPDLVAGLKNGRVPSLNGSRYFLFEPPHDVLPPRFEAFIFNLLAAGFVPILTHPERLTWVEQQLPMIARLSAGGVVMQITAASIAGTFGRRVRGLSMRLLDDGLVDIVATDAHNTDRRPPILSEARAIVAERLDEQEAERMFEINPRRILENMVLSDHSRPKDAARTDRPSLWQRIWSRRN
jgi:protein-tyrosine phosphatase